jgi:hypothetical protein
MEAAAHARLVHALADPDGGRPGRLRLSERWAPASAGPPAHRTPRPAGEAGMSTVALGDHHRPRRRRGVLRRDSPQDHLRVRSRRGSTPRSWPWRTRTPQSPGMALAHGSWGSRRSRITAGSTSARHGIDLIIILTPESGGLGDHPGDAPSRGSGSSPIPVFLLFWQAIGSGGAEAAGAHARDGDAGQRDPGLHPGHHPGDVHHRGQRGVPAEDGAVPRLR